MKMKMPDVQVSEKIEVTYLCLCCLFSQKKELNQLYDYYKLEKKSFLFPARRDIVMYKVQMSVIFLKSG